MAARTREGGKARSLPPTSPLRARRITGESKRPRATSNALDGRYRIDTLLGVGGMGRVYRARQIGTDRDVALKIVRRDEAIPAGRARFRDEAAMLARLRHPNIVTLYDFIEADDDDGPMDYLAMELVEGPCLDELLRERGKLPWQEVASIAAQIASALDHAHGRGIVHRDLKPANIAIVEEHGNRADVRVLDFGVAKLVGPVSSKNRTKPGFVVGTPAYMAPEQERGVVSPALDVFALGVLAFEAVTGKLPRGKLDFGDVPVHPDFASLVERMLADTPEGRPTAARVADELELLVREPRAAVIVPRPKRRPLALALGAMALLVTGLASGGAIASVAAPACESPAAARAAHELEMGLSPNASPAVRMLEPGRSARAPVVRGRTPAAAAPAAGAATPSSAPRPAPSAPRANVFSTDGMRTP
ncbi:MAG: serine/threonine protein kinase [Deltaproteobacteria bacterium]|nr:serine/threonine protein kinase [Deltaproteobacteria bacterium]